MFLTSPHSFVVVRACVFASLLTGLVLGTGCGDDDTTDHNNTTADVVCGGHGELHDDHCHCDSGYVPSDDELSCVASDDSEHEDDHEHEHEDDHEHEDEHQDGVEFSFAPTEMHASVGSDQDGKQVWLVDAAEGDAALSMELYEAFGGPTSPGVVDFTVDETDYASCGTCVIVRTGCEVHDDHVHCEKTFMPRAEGQLEIEAIGTAVGERLTGELKDVVLQEVTIAENYATVPVSDGEILHLDALSFDVALEDLDGAQEECSGHGHLHGDQCHCDSGFVMDPEDSAQCIPE